MRLRRVLAVLLALASPAAAEAPKKAPSAEISPHALLEEGKALEAKKDWNSARGVYEKLEANKAYSTLALYHQARVAFQILDYDKAQDLAKRVIQRAPNPIKLDAKELYGDAVYATGQYKRAKDFYLALRAQVTGARKAAIENKVVMANKALKLPERDGL